MGSIAVGPEVAKSPRGCINLTDNTAITVPIQAVIVDCTVTGVVVLTFQDGSAMTRNMQTGTVYTYSGQITKFHVTSGTATADALL